MATRKMVLWHPMTKEEVLNLGEMARIRLSDDEVEKFSTEIDAILGYVSTINDLVPSGKIEKKAGLLYNVFRDDVVTNEPSEFTADITAAFPDADGPYLKVKKILNPDA